MTFKEFNLLPSLQATLAEKSLVTPTEIQARAIPLLIGGKTVVAVSETGSGKTLSYVLPILQQLKQLENHGQEVTEDARPRAVVIVPTRELGEQVSKVFKLFTHATRLRVRPLLGGAALDDAKRNVQGKFEVLVATPGRLVKLLDRKLVSLEDARFLVFDEADQMVDQGFLPNATQIANACLPTRQLALFSATISPTVQRLMTRMFANAEIIRSHGSHKLVPTLSTQNINVVDGKRYPYLEDLLAKKKVAGGTLIFTNTRKQCDKLATELETAGRDCAIYRGEMDKVERRANLKQFRDGKIDLLVSTDLASRGLDVEHVGRVINYHMPQELENYIHRAGRTARAGRAGLVINFVTERDQDIMVELARLKTAKPAR